MDKTNVMRILDSNKIEYKPFYYSSDITDGLTIAEILSENPNNTFKTLVTVSSSKKNYVFVIPVCDSLDLKKAAKSVGEKSISMLKQNELLPTTGYIHGGCSPIGMKKKFPTVFHETVRNFEQVNFSAGKVGCQVRVNFNEANKIIGAKVDDITV